MKKMTIFSVLFLFAFGLSVGITAFSQANAWELCEVGCIYELYCDDYVGPKCPDPNYPHLLWETNGQCLDGDPTHICPGRVIGCCNK